MFVEELGNMTEDEISKIVIDSAIDVHKFLGPGLLESSYEQCLFYELLQAGLKVERQKSFPIQYKEVIIDSGYRVDLFIENKVIVELKAVDKIADVHVAQVLTYLKLSKCKLGLLLNFNTKLLKDGIKRIANGL